MPRNSPGNARLDGALLVARTLRHFLNTPLTLALGYAQLIAEDPGVPTAARADALEIVQSIAEIHQLIERLPRISEVSEIDLGLADGPVLDLTRSKFTGEA